VWSSLRRISITSSKYECWSEENVLAPVERADSVVSLELGPHVIQERRGARQSNGPKITGPV
jgi:hypothetical protein